MTGILNYGCGNMFSLKSSLDYLGERSEIISRTSDIYKCDRLILPGVGAFGNAAEKLEKSGMAQIILKLCADKIPLLGICLGMQLLFEKSFEYGTHLGLSLLKGEIMPLSADTSLKIPHIGWNSLHIKAANPLFKYVDEGEYVYFVHSFHAKNCADVLATCDYGAEICAAAGRQNVFGTQFHPEKSGDAGLRILKAFTEI